MQELRDKVENVVLSAVAVDDPSETIATATEAVSQAESSAVIGQGAPRSGCYTRWSRGETRLRHEGSGNGRVEGVGLGGEGYGVFCVRKENIVDTCICSSQ